MMAVPSYKNQSGFYMIKTTVRKELKKCFNLWRVLGSVTIKSFQNVKYSSEGVLFLVKLQTDVFQNMRLMAWKTLQNITPEQFENKTFEDYLEQVLDPFEALALREKAFSQYFLSFPIKKYSLRSTFIMNYISFTTWKIKIIYRNVLRNGLTGFWYDLTM